MHKHDPKENVNLIHQFFTIQPELDRIKAYEDERKAKLKKLGFIGKTQLGTKIIYRNKPPKIENLYARVDIPAGMLTGVFASNAILHESPELATLTKKEKLNKKEQKLKRKLITDLGPLKGSVFIKEQARAIKSTSDKEKNHGNLLKYAQRSRDHFNLAVNDKFEHYAINKEALDNDDEQPGIKAGDVILWARDPELYVGRNRPTPEIRDINIGNRKFSEPEKKKKSNPNLDMS